MSLLAGMADLERRKLEDVIETKVGDKKEKQDGRKGKKGRITPFGPASREIKAGERMLVRETKGLEPGLDEPASEGLLENARRMEESISMADYKDAMDNLDRALAPLIEGPGYMKRRKRKLILVPLILAILASILILFLV